MARTIDIKLEPYGMANEWVRIKDPKLLPWGQTKALLNMFGDDASKVTPDQTEALILDLVTAWHVTAADDEAVVLDGTPTAEQLQRVPNIVLEAIAVTIKRRMEQQLPPA